MIIYHVVTRFARHIAVASSVHDWAMESSPTAVDLWAAADHVDDLRITDYDYLDRDRHVYLDYTGAGLPARRQLRAHTDRIMAGCYGNPHSDNPSSRASTELVERARAAVLDYFRASPDEYAVIFSANASQAMRLVAEAYPFGRGVRFVLAFDNHNSVNGIREYARSRGAEIDYVPLTPGELYIDPDIAHRHLQRPTRRRWVSGRGTAHRRGLFAFPAQSNFTGVQHPLSLIELAHQDGYDVLLDAAAYVPTNRLDLSRLNPDFVPVSWYKVFGYPTGLGCLIARREALSRLRRPWFSGGTIQAVSVQGDWHLLAPDESAFEDGTLNFLSIPDIEFGLSWLEHIGIDVIHRRVTVLTGILLERLAALRHSNARPLVRLYGPADTTGRGATVAFNFLDPDGRIIDERVVSRDSSAHGISLRTGCFCNPGAGEAAFGIMKSDLTRSILRNPHTIDEYLSLLGLPSAGAIRVSFGIASNLGDLERFLRFAEGTYRDRYPDTAGLAPRLRC
jgi:selenocysteine lyase/cysteine desulfurase